jgi:glycosyltransferase involved in cell wall biosynthesis
MKNILIISPYFPYPTNFGGAFDIYNKLLLLSERGYNITLICTENTEVPSQYKEVVNKSVDKLLVIKRKKNIFYLLKLKPYQVVSRNQLRKLEIGNKFDFMILESEYVGAILKNKNLKNVPFILRLHNEESTYYMELYKSENKLFPSIYYFLESKLFSFYSKQIIELANKICCISSTEAQGISKIYPDKNVKFTPVAFDRKNGIIRSLTSKTVLYVGALFTPNNIESIKWYLHNVHPMLKDIEGYNFKIVGSTKNEDQKEWLEEVLLRDNSVSVYFNLADLEWFYNEASVFVNPVLNGAGVKIKNLNAISEGLPLVTTTKGNDGSGFSNQQHILIADSPIDFEQYVRKLLLDFELRKKIAGNALIRMNYLYNNKAIIDDFIL